MASLVFPTRCIGKTLRMIFYSLFFIFYFFLVHGFFTTCCLLKNLNRIFIGLIPKVHTLEIFQFRPINLYNSAYNVISKVLTNCLKFVLKCLIFEN